MVRVAGPSSEDIACRRAKLEQVTMKTRTEVRVASPSCVDSALRRTVIHKEEPMQPTQVQDCVLQAAVVGSTVRG